MDVNVLPLHCGSVVLGNRLLCCTSSREVSPTRDSLRRLFASCIASWPFYGIKPVYFMYREAEAGGFWSYVAGTAYKVATEHIIGGMQLDNYRTTLPLKKGLSSSAAICVLVRLIFASEGGFGCRQCYLNPTLL